jgi:hypothetical protein
LENYFVITYAKNGTKQFVKSQIRSQGITDFSSYNSDNKLRQKKPKRTGLQFLRGLISQLFLWTAAAGGAYAQAAAEKNWA